VQESAVTDALGVGGVFLEHETAATSANNKIPIFIFIQSILDFGVMYNLKKNY
jgi:hypothetical protein